MHRGRKGKEEGKGVGRGGAQGGAGTAAGRDSGSEAELAGCWVTGNHMHSQCRLRLVSLGAPSPGGQGPRLRDGPGAGTVGDGGRGGVSQPRFTPASASALVPLGSVLRSRSSASFGQGCSHSGAAGVFPKDQRVSGLGPSSSAHL